MSTSGPRPVPPVGGVTPLAATRLTSSLQSGVLLDLSEPAAAGLRAPGSGLSLPWRVGDAVSGRVVKSGSGQALLRFGQTVIAAKTDLALPAGAQAEFVVRRMRGPRIELQLLTVERAADGRPAAAAQQQAGQAAPVGGAWQLAFVLPGHGEASVTGVPGPDSDEQRRQAGAPDDRERLVIRWESTHLGEVELELDVGARLADGRRPVRLAARAGAGTIAALRNGLPGLGERLGELGFAVQMRTVAPLRRRRSAPSAATRLDTRL